MTFRNILPLVMISLVAAAGGSLPLSETTPFAYPERRRPWSHSAFKENIKTALLCQGKEGV